MYICIYIYIYIYFIYIKIPKSLSAKYYKENKERKKKKKAHERYQNLSKEEKDNMVVNITSKQFSFALQ